MASIVQLSFNFAPQPPSEAKRVPTQFVRMAAPSEVPPFPSPVPEFRGVRRDSWRSRWCHGCHLEGLCDSDECGRRPESDINFNACVAHAWSSDFRPTSFPNLGIFIEFLKAHGWH